MNSNINYLPVQNIPAKRFEVQVGSALAELDYELNNDVILFTSTRVPAELEGRGIGSALVKTGLEFARDNQLKVKTTCWFVSGYIERHTEYASLYAE